VTGLLWKQWREAQWYMVAFAAGALLLSTIPWALAAAGATAESAFRFWYVGMLAPVVAAGLVAAIMGAVAGGGAGASTGDVLVHSSPLSRGLVWTAKAGSGLVWLLLSWTLPLSLIYSTLRQAHASSAVASYMELWRPSFLGLLPLYLWAFVLAILGFRALSAVFTSLLIAASWAFCQSLLTQPIEVYWLGPGLMHGPARTLLHVVAPLCALPIAALWGYCRTPPAHMAERRARSLGAFVVLLSVVGVVLGVVAVRLPERFPTRPNGPIVRAEVTPDGRRLCFRSASGRLQGDSMASWVANPDGSQVMCVSSLSRRGRPSPWIPQLEGCLSALIAMRPPFWIPEQGDTFTCVWLVRPGQRSVRIAAEQGSAMPARSYMVSPDASVMAVNNGASFLPIRDGAHIPQKPGGRSRIEMLGWAPDGKSVYWHARSIWEDSSLLGDKARAPQGEDVDEELSGTSRFIITGESREHSEVAVLPGCEVVAHDPSSRTFVLTPAWPPPGRSKPGWLLSLPSGASTRVDGLGDMQAFAVSPDGAYVAACAPKQTRCIVHVCACDAGRLVASRPLPWPGDFTDPDPDPDQEYRRVTAPPVTLKWSPDSRLLAAHAHEDRQAKGILVLDTEGNELGRLQESPVRGPSELAGWTDTGELVVTQPDWGGIWLLHPTSGHSRQVLKTSWNDVYDWDLRPLRRGDPRWSGEQERQPEAWHRLPTRAVKCEGPSAQQASSRAPERRGGGAA